MSAAIVCKHLVVEVNAGNGRIRRVLNDLDARFTAGRLNLVSGGIGTGKSTLLGTLAGLRRPTSGEVIIDGQAVSRWMGDHRHRWRRQAGIVFQHGHLMHDLTVLENVMLPLVPLGLSLADCRRKSGKSLESVSLLHLAGSTVGTLSGGEKQKATIARALVARPMFIFADEPTAHQDMDGTRQVMALLGRCAQEGAVVIVATHETDLGALPGDIVHYRLDSGNLHRANP